MAFPDVSVFGDAISDMLQLRDHTNNCAMSACNCVVTMRSN